MNDLSVCIECNSLVEPILNDGPTFCTECRSIDSLIYCEDYFKCNNCQIKGKCKHEEEKVLYDSDNEKDGIFESMYSTFNNHDGKFEGKY